MGAYTCQYGVVHKRCRCPQPHTVRCDVPDVHAPKEDKKTLDEFIDEVERVFFRTGHDTGANANALIVWNQLRKYAGRERLTRDDLIRRHAETDGKSFEDMKAEYEAFDAWYKEYSKR